MCTKASELKEKKRTDKTPGQMVKAKLYRQNHTEKHIHTHSQKEEKEKNCISIYKKEKEEESNQINKQIYQ